MDKIIPSPIDYDPSTGNFHWQDDKAPVVLFGAVNSLTFLTLIIYFYKNDDENKHMKTYADFIGGSASVVEKLFSHGIPSEKIFNIHNSIMLKALEMLKETFNDKAKKDKENMNDSSSSIQERRKKRNVLLRVFLKINFPLSLIFYWLIPFTIILSWLLIGIQIITTLRSDSSISISLIINSLLEIRANVQYPLLSIFSFIYLLTWRNRWKRSVDDQIDLLYRVCEMSEDFNEIYERLEQFITQNTGYGHQAMFSRATGSFPYLAFKKTNVTWDLRSLLLFPSMYDYVYLIIFSILIFPFDILIEISNASNLQEIQLTPLFVLGLSFLGILLLSNIQLFHFLIPFKKILRFFKRSEGRGNGETKTPTSHRFSFFSMMLTGPYSQNAGKNIHLSITSIAIFWANFFSFLFDDQSYINNLLRVYCWFTFVMFIWVFIYTYYRNSERDQSLFQSLEEKEFRFVNSLSNKSTSSDLNNRDNTLSQLHSAMNILERKRSNTIRSKLAINYILLSIIFPILLQFFLQFLF